MSSAEPPKPPETSKPLDAELRKDLLKMVGMAVPTAIIALAMTWMKDKFVDHPGQTLFFIIPGILVLAILFVGSTIRQRLKLGWPFLVFLLVYLLTFYVAAEYRVLDWKRIIVGSREVAPRNSLALNSYGDWHYRVASEEPPLQNLAIVLMKPPETYQQGRLEIADLLAIAQSSGARGVALDSYFVKYKPDKDPVEKGIDEYLCSRIEAARSKGMKVFVAYGFQSISGRLDKVPMDPDLEKCLPPSDQGHLMGYAEWDGVVRSIPLYFWNEPQSEAFSLKIARSLDPSVKVPHDRALQFIKPSEDFPTISFAKLDQSEDERSILNDRFVLAGEESLQDSFHTPYGLKRGVVIHAYAVQALLNNHFIKRPPWWISLILVSVWCYLMMVLIARSVGNVKLILTNAAVSLLIVVMAALVMHFWQTWIDVIYPLIATWLYMLLLIILRRIGLKRMRLSNA
jgi:CHASE2 domain-containing sensor protein